MYVYRQTTRVLNLFSLHQDVHRRKRLACPVLHRSVHNRTSLSGVRSNRIQDQIIQVHGFAATLWPLEVLVTTASVSLLLFHECRGYAQTIVFKRVSNRSNRSRQNAAIEAHPVDQGHQTLRLGTVTGSCVPGAGRAPGRQVSERPGVWSLLVAIRESAWLGPARSVRPGGSAARRSPGVSDRPGC
jgi:hypothetical protein